MLNSQHWKPCDGSLDPNCFFIGSTAPGKSHSRQRLCSHSTSILQRRLQRSGSSTLLHPALHTCTDEEEEEEEEDKPKTKSVKETVWDWDLLNDNKALWLRSPSDVTDEEYLNFYKALAKVWFRV
jgi:hypothetical protein